METKHMRVGKTREEKLREKLRKHKLKPETKPNKLKYLKIKIKSLAAEGQIIRLEEQKAKKWGRGFTYDAIYRHRINLVRPEARAALLAYALLRGRPRQSVEVGDKKLTPMLQGQIDRIVRQFGDGTNVSAEAWWNGLTTLKTA